MKLTAGAGDAISDWTHPGTAPPSRADEVQHIPLLDRDGVLPAMNLTIRYRLDPTLVHGFNRLEAPYHRLLLALLGLSGYPLLCLVYMFLQARSLRDRVARESAQAATLDLADRTCHELGNVAFVLANERGNLADHLELIDRFLLESPDALRRAAVRAGLDGGQTERFLKALHREYADRGIDPGIEMQSSATIAREVCRQIAVAGDYISLTVRELDGYLKQSALPVRLEAVDAREMLKDALTLLGPHLASGSISVDRIDGAAPPVALADRRLFVHALVNLLKNAAEAATERGREPEVRVCLGGDADSVRVELRDNGPGIPASLRARIFDLGVSTKGAGRGRGLAIVRESVESQGGRIDVSDTSDDGTTFTLTFPRAHQGGSRLA
jgi:signal transduction histidine kinase